MILEVDELNIPSVGAAGMPAPADVVHKSTIELKKPADHLGPEAWFDIELGRYLLEDRPLPALEEDGLASVAQDQRLSPGPLEDMINQRNNGDTECTPEEPEADTLPT